MLHRREFTALTLASAAGLAAPHIARAASLQPLSVRLDWVAGADHAALFLAKQRGYYEEAGLDVQINDGKGSASTLQMVGAGNDTVGIANLATMALAVGAGASVMAIACILQTAPDGLVALASSGITKPKDLEGKRWGSVLTESGARIFPAFARATGIDASTIKRIQISQGTSYSSLLLGSVDFISGWSIADALKIARVKPIAPPITFAHYGVNALGNGLFTTRETVAKRASFLKAFLEATVKGEAAAQKDPQGAIDALVAARPSTKPDIMLQEASMLKDYTHTVATEGKPFGWMAESDWVKTVKLMQDCCKLPSSVEVAGLYTNGLLPGG
jgi:NitT/TauT family transport system substrate-binding protein